MVRETSPLWEQLRGKQAELRAEQIWPNAGDDEVFQMTPTFSQGSWRTLGDTECPQIQIALAKELRQCWCRAVPRLLGSPDSTPTHRFHTQPEKLNNQQHSPAVSNFDFVYNYHDSKTMCAKHLIVISMIFHTLLVYRKLKSVYSFLFHGRSSMQFSWRHQIFFTVFFSFTNGQNICIGYHNTYRFYTAFYYILSNKSIFGWIYQVCVLCSHMLATESMRVVLSCVNNKRIAGRSMPEEMFYLNTGCSLQKQKGLLRKDFPAWKRHFLSLPPSGSAASPNAPSCCSKLWACPPAETKAHPGLTSWKCAGSTAGL